MYKFKRSLLCDELLVFLELSPLNPRVTPGSALNMKCAIWSDKCNRTSANLTFEFDLANSSIITVSKHYVRIINNETVELNYPAIPLYFDKAEVSCLVHSRRKSCRETETDTDELRVGRESVLVCSLRAYLLHVLSAVSNRIEWVACFHSLLNYCFVYCACYCACVLFWKIDHLFLLFTVFLLMYFMV